MEKASRLRPYVPEEGGCPVRLDANESGYDLPRELTAKIAGALQSVPFHRYPDPLAEKVCAAFAALHGVDPGLVTAGNGSDELISVLMNTFVPKGGKVLMTAPDFSMYRFYCDFGEYRPAVLPKGGDLMVGAGELIAAARREKPDLLIFSNPCNPTGQGLLREDALRVAAEAGCTVVVDEAYMDFWNQSLLSCPALPENCIVLRTCSKVGLAALRLGFAVAPARLTGYIRAAKSPYNVNALTQAAGEIVLGEPGWLKSAAARAVRLKEALEDALSALAARYPGKFEPIRTHTNFTVVRAARAGKIHGGLRKRGVSVRYFPEELLRVTAGTEEENGAFLAALESVLKEGGC